MSKEVEIVDKIDEAMNNTCCCMGTRSYDDKGKCSLCGKIRTAQAIYDHRKEIGFISQEDVDDERLAEVLHGAGLNAHTHPDNLSAYDWNKYRLKLSQEIIKELFNDKG